MLWSLDVMAYQILADICVCSCYMCVLRETQNIAISSYGTNIKADITTG
jgi:hypothetical protein